MLEESVTPLNRNICFTLRRRERDKWGFDTRRAKRVLKTCPYGSVPESDVLDSQSEIEKRGNRGFSIHRMYSMEKKDKLE